MLLKVFMLNIYKSWNKKISFPETLSINGGEHLLSDTIVLPTYLILKSDSNTHPKIKITENSAVSEDPHSSKRRCVTSTRIAWILSLSNGNSAATEACEAKLLRYYDSATLNAVRSEETTHVTSMNCQQKRDDLLLHWISTRRANSPWCALWLWTRPRGWCCHPNSIPMPSVECLKSWLCAAVGGEAHRPVQHFSTKTTPTRQKSSLCQSAYRFCAPTSNFGKLQDPWNMSIIE